MAASYTPTQYPPSYPQTQPSYQQPQQSYQQPQPFYQPSVPQFVPQPEAHKIRDWLPWSIISLIIGWGLGGILPLIFSIICRSNKRRNDLQGARTMSNLALIFNILITIGGIAAWIGFIIWIVWYVRFINEITNT